MCGRLEQHTADQQSIKKATLLHPRPALEPPSSCHKLLPSDAKTAGVFRTFNQQSPILDLNYQR
ncbi:hypothetical protein E4U51_006704 [Claviceps purpurea]|nr:hypothetical protein E4U51_006704 [Claviceps purpurea]